MQNVEMYTVTGIHIWCVRVNGTIIIIIIIYQIANYGNFNQFSLH